MGRQATNQRNDGVSVRDAMRAFELSIGTTVAETSKRNYARCLDEFAMWCEGHGLELGDIKPTQIREYTLWLSERPKLPYGGVERSGKQPEGRLSTSSVQAHIRVLKLFMRWCSKEEELEDVVSQRTASRIDMPRSNKRMYTVFTEEEVERLLVACKEEMSEELITRDRAIILVLLQGGIRNGELCNLTLEDVHGQTGKLTYLKVNGKTGEREVQLGLKASKALHWYISRYRKNSNRTERHVFLTRSHQAMKPNGVHQILERLGRLAGVPDCYPHKFRHTYSVNQSKRGRDTSDIQKSLGHSAISTTALYLSTYSSRDARESYLDD